MTVQISKTYKKNQREIAEISARVVEKMENNPAYSNPPAALAALKKEQPEYLIALQRARSRDIELISIKNDKKAIVLALLDELAAYVVNTANGDRTIMLSSGFYVADEESKTTPAPSIEALDVTVDAAGEATMQVRNVTGNVAYIHQYATESPGANTVWVSEGSSKGYYTFQGLASDKRYWFRVVVIGRAGQRSYSPVVSKVIQ
jgi:hypothetical protein